VNLKPILVIGAGRGGTSLLTACLGGHPGIEMRSEYHSAPILIGDDEPIRSVATLLEDRLAHLNAVCDVDRARHPGSIWGNKITTEQIRGLEEHNFLNGKSVDVVARFARAMGEYREIFITRDGRACVESKARRTGQPMMRAALSWCYKCPCFGTFSLLRRVVRHRALRGLGPVARGCVDECVRCAANRLSPRHAQPDHAFAAGVSAWKISQGKGY